MSTFFVDDKPELWGRGRSESQLINLFGHFGGIGSNVIFKITDEPCIVIRAIDDTISYSRSRDSTTNRSINCSVTELGDYQPSCLSELFCFLRSRHRRNGMDVQSVRLYAIEPVRVNNFEESFVLPLSVRYHINAIQSVSRHSSKQHWPCTFDKTRSSTRRYNSEMKVMYAPIV